MATDSSRFDDVAEHAAIRGFEPDFTDVDGIRTRYYDEGSGDPLVLLHGGCWSGTLSANGWTHIMEPLSDDFRVLAFDRIGCGMSDNPDDPADFNFRTELDNAIAFLDEMGIETCHLAGSSWGAGLASRVAAEIPDRIETLLLTNSYALNPRHGDRDHRARRLLERGAPNTDPTDPDLIRYRYEQYCYRTENIADEFCEAAAYMRSRPKAEETAEVLRSQEEQVHASRKEEVEEVHRRIRAGELTMPVLYLYGRNDITVPLSTATGTLDLFAQGNPNARLSIYPECGHVPPMEHPDELASEVRDFIHRWH